MTDLLTENPNSVTTEPMDTTVIPTTVILTTSTTHPSGCKFPNGILIGPNKKGKYELQCKTGYLLLHENENIAKCKNGKLTVTNSCEPVVTTTTTTSTSTTTTSTTTGPQPVTILPETTDIPTTKKLMTTTEPNLTTDNESTSKEKVILSRSVLIIYS